MLSSTLLMPRLTKREKKRRDIHHQHIFSLGQFVKTQNSIQPQSPAHLPSPPATFEFRSDVKPQKEIFHSDFALVQRDIIKITIFTISALLVQSMIYFLLQRS